MAKIKNWLLAVVLALLGSADLIFGVFVELVKEAGLPSYYIQVFRITALLLTVVLVKQQPPSLKEEKRRRRVKSALSDKFNQK